LIPVTSPRNLRLSATLAFYSDATRPHPDGGLPDRRQYRVLEIQPAPASMAPPVESRLRPRRHRCTFPLFRLDRRPHLVRHPACSADLHPRHLAPTPRRQRLDRRAARKVSPAARLAAARSLTTLYDQNPFSAFLNCGDSAGRAQESAGGRNSGTTQTANSAAVGFQRLLPHDCGRRPRLQHRNAFQQNVADNAQAFRADLVQRVLRRVPVSR